MPLASGGFWFIFDFLQYEEDQPVENPVVFVLTVMAVILVPVTAGVYLFLRLIYYADKLSNKVLTKHDVISFYSDYFISERHGKVHCRDIKKYEIRIDNMVSNYRIVLYCKSKTIHYALDVRTSYKKPNKISDHLLATWADDSNQITIFHKLARRFEKFIQDWNSYVYQSNGHETHFIYKEDYFRRPWPVFVAVFLSIAIVAFVIVILFALKNKLPVLGTIPVVLYMLIKINSYMWGRIVEARRGPL